MKKGRKILALCLSVVAAFAGFGLVGCGDKSEEITICMPDGAPALAFAGLMYSDTSDDGVTYRVVDASAITSKISANDMDDNADLCVLPVNVAGKRLGDGKDYQMIGLVTQGNLYFISNKEVATVDDLSVLTGKKVGLAQIANVPGLTLKAALNRRNVAWTELKSGAAVKEDEVNLQGLASGSAIDGSLPYYLAAEPLVTTMTMNGKFRVVGDLQTLYNGAESETIGYPQAVLVAKRSFLEKNGDWTKAFLVKLAESNEWLKTASAQDIYVSVVRHFEDPTHKAVFSLGALTQECIARCGISFAYAKDCSARVDTFLAELVEISPNMAGLAEENFYWLG